LQQGHVPHIAAGFILVFFFLLLILDFGMSNDIIGSIIDHFERGLPFGTPTAIQYRVVTDLQKGKIRQMWK
jgi:hypothetical protein